jgi:hypothetical protein
MTTTEITPALHYLEGKDLESFTIEVESVQRKLKDAWRDTLDAMQDLERIRWGTKWLDDPIWKEWDEAAQRHGAKRAERSWFSWLGRRGGFSWNERELTDHQTYNRLLATWVLTVAIEIHNARVVEGEKAPPTVGGAFAAELLPPPTAISQVNPFLSKIARTDELPESWASNPDAVALGIGTHQYPYLPPAEQDELITAWSLCVYTNIDSKTNQLRYQTTSSGISIPVPPTVSFSTSKLMSMQVPEDEDTKRQRDSYVEAKKAETQPERDARIKREREAAERSRQIWKDIDTESEARKRYNEAQLEHLKQQKQRLEETAPIRDNAFKYNELLVAMTRSISNLRRFVEEVESIKGTQFFNEMRGYQLPLVTVADDVPRLQQAGTELVEICKKVTTSNPPTGIKFAKTINEDGSEVADLEVI